MWGRYLIAGTRRITQPSTDRAFSHRATITIAHVDHDKFNGGNSCYCFACIYWLHSYSATCSI
ncbi:hypothetical protein COCC4DRAFT_65065 [Bipolaris maydis ATCC 48331]|uniref:Uncharacterized protein n=2 Tax=Cochliobolus heterostrophus TaxID=5016 RepID=M2UNK2_COCH5|nr:uncharacterized protein COCC4DRAFT_65065 [Bipolaris maydis ATCC 48331]EMD95176.1 hypothetical protein COCHEDRAFT_1153009 [Bipolaris maydis C5]ENI00933.1 hypothetical protein COCC4DRAFT_65065 [Bipolaris maydis ATCC 48331]